MANNNDKSGSSIYLDTNAAQHAIDKLNAKIAQYDRQLQNTNLTAKEVAAIQKSRAEVAAKATALQVQVEQKLGSTLKQQKAYVSDLKKALDTLPPGTKEFEKALKELKSAEKVLDSIKNKIKDVETAQKSAAKAPNFMSSFLGNIAANAMNKAIDFLKQTAAQVVDIAKKVGGIEKAFDALNRPGLLDQLRRATKGTISDLDLMQKAVRANNFRIPLEQLGTLLRFAQIRARETGDDVNYLADSIVLGISRKSIPIMDNLGISATELNKEVAKTGDFAKASLNIVNRELAKSGSYTDNFADKWDRFLAWWQNKLTSIGSAIAKMFESAKSADQLFDEAKQKTEAYKNTLDPLIAMYDQLKSKTTLNKDEQALLQGVIQKIAQVVPNAVTEFDKYGNALDINKEKVKAFLKENDKFLKLRNKEAIDEIQSEAGDVVKEIQRAVSSRSASVKSRDRYREANISRLSKSSTNPEVRARAAAQLDQQNAEMDIKFQVNIAKQQEKLIGLAGTLKEKYNTELNPSLKEYYDGAIKAKYGTEALIKAQTVVVKDFISVEKLENDIKGLTEEMKTMDIASKEFAEMLKKKKALEKQLADATGANDKKDEAAAKKAAHEREQAIEKLTELQKKVNDAKAEADAAASTEEGKNNAEILRTRKQYTDLLLEAEKHVEKMKKVFGAATYDKTYKKQFEEMQKDLIAAGDKDVNTVLKKQFDERSKKEFEASKKSLNQYFENRRSELDKGYAQELLDAEENELQQIEVKRQYEKQNSDLDLEQKENLIIIARDYVASVKEAEFELVEYTRQAEETKTATQIAEAEKRVAAAKEAADIKKDIDSRSATAAAELAVARTAPGTGARADAEAKLAKLQKEQHLRELKERHKEEQLLILQNTALTEQEKARLVKESQTTLGNEVAAVEEQFRQEKLQREIEFYTTLFDQVLTLAQGIAEIVQMDAQVKKAKEDAELARRLKNNDREKASWQRLLNSRFITQQEYNRRVKQLDDEYRAKEASAKKKQWERQQKADIGTAIIRGASAVLSALATQPFYLGLALAILATFKTQKEIQTIKKQPVPEFARGGVTRGPSHAAGGIDMINSKTGQKVGEMEGGEPYMILSGNTYKNNKETVDALLDSSTRRNGASIKPFWQARPYKSIDTAGVARSVTNVRRYANGGTFNSAQASESRSAESAATVVDIPGIDALGAAVNELANRMDQPVKSYVLYSEISAASQVLDQIKEDAIMKRSK